MPTPCVVTAPIAYHCDMRTEVAGAFRLVWIVDAVDRRTRSLIKRRLTLDLSTVPPADRAAIERIADECKWPQMARYRRYWMERPLEGPGPPAGMFCRTGAFCVPGYYEDEEGNRLDELRFLQTWFGSDDILVQGNPDSVLRLGNAEMVNRDKWTVDKSNSVAHFLEVVDCLARSRWVRSRTSYKSDPDEAGNQRIVDFQRPDVLVMNSVLVFIRQLLSEGDRLFQLATDAYLFHVGDAGKKWFVTNERTQFNEILRKPTFLFNIGGKSGRELLYLFFYGFGLVHRSDPEKAKEFREVIDAHGKEVVVMAIQSALQHLYGHAYNVAHIIHQDFSQWVTTQQCAPPDRVGIVDLLGDISGG
jgi:hypothetical protein